MSEPRESALGCHRSKILVSNGRLDDTDAKVATRAPVQQMLPKNAAKRRSFSLNMCPFRLSIAGQSAFLTRGKRDRRGEGIAHGAFGHALCVRCARASEHTRRRRFFVSSQSALSAAAAVVHRLSCAFGWQRSQHQAATTPKQGLSETKHCLTKRMRPAVKMSAH